MLLEGRGEDFRRHFLITHFFNPVRFMKLLELVPGPDTDPELMALHGRHSGADRLGKGVVYCKDRPNFIGNRIGTLWLHGDHPPDAGRGLSHRGGRRHLRPAMGRAKVGGLPHRRHRGHRYAACMSPTTSTKICPNDPQRDLFRMPEFVREMVARGWTGDKRRPGLLQAREGAERQVARFWRSIRPTLEYRPQEKVHFPSHRQREERIPTRCTGPHRGRTR